MESLKNHKEKDDRDEDEDEDDKSNGYRAGNYQLLPKGFQLI